ncbi:unnamed protein product [[Candida] boidinii]|nr:unnamed protein product [[Candida] boidinii]
MLLNQTLLLLLLPVDLKKMHQKRLFSKVGEWDNILVSSSERISQLYTDSIAAQESQTKIDQTLDYIEKQQDELDQLLEGYEAQAETLLSKMNLENSSSGLNAINDNTLTNDQIRAKAYRTAELLENKLDGLGANFSLLISEIQQTVLLILQLL